MSSVAPVPRFSRLVAGVVLARRQWQVLLGLLAIVVCYLALVPTPPQEASFGWDKANHALAFLALTVSGTFGFRGARRNLLWVVLGIFGLGCAIELIQLFVPGRSCDWHDLVADTVGIVLGLGLALAALRVAIPTR
jgi:VanZ family protein